MSPNQGGIETFMMNIFLRLEGKQFHFDFLNSYREGIAYSREIENNGGTVRDVIIPNSIKGHLVRRHRMMDFLLKHHNYDIVHVNAMSINAIFWLKMANKFNINKLIIQSHVDNRTYKSLFTKISATLLALISRCYLNMHSNIIELAVNKPSGQYMFHNNDFTVIPNGIDTDKFKFNLDKRLSLKNKFGLNYNDKIIITVAKISYQKNYFKIINIFKFIHKKDSHVKLVIVGDGPERKQIKHLVNKLGLTNYVIFLGIINDVNDVLNIADLMLMPSRYEGFPFSLIESQAVGVPALVSSEAVPISSNVTDTLKYVSLKRSNEYWAKIALKMLYNSPSINGKLKMNAVIKKSKYNINSLIKSIKQIYLSEDE